MAVPCLVLDERGCPGKPQQPLEVDRGVGVERRAPDESAGAVPSAQSREVEGDGAAERDPAPFQERPALPPGSREPVLARLRIRGWDLGLAVDGRRDCEGENGGSCHEEMMNLTQMGGPRCGGAKLREIPGGFRRRYPADRQPRRELEAWRQQCDAPSPDARKPRTALVARDLRT